MCGKGRAEPLICLMQIVELVRQTALSKSAIRRAKRAEGKCEAFREAAPEWAVSGKERQERIGEKEMRKKWIAAGIGMIMAVSLTGCSGKLSNDYVTINQYKGLEVSKVEKTEVTDEMVENTINS